MVSLFFYLPDFPFEISNLLRFPVQTWIRHLKVLVHLGRFSDFLLDLGSVVLRLFKNGFVLDKTALHRLQLRVAFSRLREHRLNLLTQPFDAGRTAYAPNLLLRSADFSLEAQNFFLVNYELFTEILCELRVLICYPAVSYLQLASDMRVLIRFACSCRSRSKAPLNDLKFAHFLLGDFVLSF